MNAWQKTEQRAKGLDALEGLVDRIGLASVVDALGEIAHGKAGHVEANWQDHVMAKQWRKAGTLLNAAAAKLETIDTGGHR